MSESSDMSKSSDMGQSSALIRSIQNQSRASMLGAGLAVAAMWISIPMGEWKIGVFFVAGLVLGLVNQVLTEHMLLVSVEGDGLVTRKQFATKSLIRLLGISFVAIALAIVFWPDGAAALIGLALFHLVTLILTAIPLLKEVNKV